MLEVQDASGGVLHRRTLSPDWEPAVQWAQLAGVCTHGANAGAVPEARVEPVWHAAGAPVVAGIRVRMTSDDLAWFEDCPADAYFGDTKRAVVAELLAAGSLQPDDTVRLVTTAYAVDVAAITPAAVFHIEERAPHWSPRDRGFDTLVAQSVPCGEHDATDLQVVVPDHVLEEMVALTQAAGECETGGVLIGHLCVDSKPRAIGVEVTAQIPARHTVGDATKLTFTSETWTDVRAAVRLRGRDELLLGSWHSHPAHAWCKACPLERQRECQLAAGFMSADDRALHRAMFPAAFSQAVVVTRSVLGTHASWFGWRRGTIQPRGFRLTPGGAGHAPLAWAAVRPASGGGVEACGPKPSEVVSMASSTTGKD